MQEGTGEGEKTFVIHPKKTFVVHRESTPLSTIAHTKSFAIISERYPVQIPDTDRQVMFTHQRNESDCGPSMVLNTFSVLGIPTPYESVVAVRQQNNVLRAQEQTSALGDSDWFLTTDVSRMLQEHGLDVEPYSIRSSAQEADFRQSLQRKVVERRSFVIYSGTGRHFKGIYSPDGERYYLIDSQKHSIGQVQQNKIQQLISNAKSSDRPETVALTYRRESR